MRSTSVRTNENATANARSNGGSLRIEHLAQELHSLLDGCWQNVNVAQRELNEARERQLGPLDSTRSRLDAAAEGLREATRVLARAMRSRAAGFELFHDPRTLEALVEHHLQLVQPWAEDQGIAIQTQLTPKAASMNAGLLGPVILNGLRNAIRACSVDELQNRRVELSIALTAEDDLVILVVDTGRGMPRVDHVGRADDSGLGVAQLIVEHLGGEIRVTNVPFSEGTILQVTVPGRRMESHV